MRPLPEASNRPLGTGPFKYVSPTGQDSAVGTADRPWRSVGHAVDRLEPGDTLLVRGGTYFENVRIQARGTAARPITVRAYPGELAVLDGGIAEFQTAPDAAWEPVAGGAADEYRSARRYPGLGRATGFFGDSMVPLHSYVWLRDLRSDEARWHGHQQELYCGPGLWYDPRSQRIHVRLAHDRADHLPASHRYRGVRDPRRLPLLVTGGRSLPLHIRGAEHLVLKDLVVRGGATASVWIEDASNVVLAGMTVYSGFHAARLERSRSVRIVDSRFRGPSAPWSSRATLKYRGLAGVLLRTAGVLHKNERLEIASSEFTDGHDGVFLGDARDVDFHHNLVENFNDDGIFLTSRGAPNGPIRIYRNRISRCLSSLAFGWGRDQPNLTGKGVDVYRNVVTHLEPVYYFPPEAGKAPSDHVGNLVRDHGSPTWEPMRIYQNTFVVREAERWRYALGLGTHMSGTRRDVFNNVFLHLDDVPEFTLPGSEADYRSDGNLFWSRAVAARYDPLARYRQGPAFTASRARYRPGWEAASVFADPLLDGFRPRPGSPLIDAGVPVPREWPDPLRGTDAGAPDIGALPFGSEPLRVGPGASSGSGTETP